MKEKNQKSEKRKYRQLMDDIKNVFKDVSNNYKQKLVYNLLNTVKGNNQKEFFWIILRALNAKSDKSDVAKVSEKIKELYPLSSSEFEKVAYSIILGIMSSGGD